MFSSLTMCMQLCNFAYRYYCYAVKRLSWQSQRWPPVPWALRWKTNSPKRRLPVSQATASKMEMSIFSRSITVIHHDSHWLIRHDTLSVRVRQYSGNRSGSGMYCMHANDLCGEPGVIRYHHWDKPCRNIPVKTLGRPRITREIRT